ncbi:MAG: HDOD domain-containing protein, partial [Candidatus Hydrogenedentes bacterium]|nr:HDOD domain-containing protein [Candidatus Hydrogenedentota bacterium]
SVQRAVVTIGFEAVKELALATTVVDCVQRARQSVLEAADFWMHSFGAGKAAQLLAISSGRADAAPLCFTAGILHDLGKLLLAITLGAEYRQHTRYARQLGLRLCDVEQREYGIDHAEIGEAFLRHWRVPGTICDCVKYQYVPAAYPGEHRLEVAIVSASSEISRLCQFGNGGDDGPFRLPPFHDLACGPSAEALTETIAALPPFRAEAAELLNVLRPTE